MNILLLESYDTGSHRAWMQGYRAHSQHKVKILSLPGQFWQWRMQGGAVSLARLFLETHLSPDLIVASDMVNLATFLALTRQRTAQTPTALYFHENQLTYPIGPRQRKAVQLQLGLVNYFSAMAADALFFNSQYHLESFFAELPRALKHYPDYNELESVPLLQARAAVLPLGLDLRRFDALRPPGRPAGPPLIVWNHRWDYDKNPKAFLNALLPLVAEGLDFRVALVGENLRQLAEEFESARKQLGQRVVQYGYVTAFEDYARLLWQADLQVSTAWHDFFGVSTCEAIYCGCAPLLPRRLNYPALLPAAHQAEYLYPEGRVGERMRQWLLNPTPPPPALRAHIARFDWTVQAPHYDAMFAAVATARR